KEQGMPYQVRFAGEKGFLVIDKRGAGFTQSVQVVPTGSDKKWPEISLTKREVAAAALSLDLRMVALMFANKSEELEVEIYDTNTGKPAGLPSFIQEKRAGSILEFSPNGRYVLASTEYRSMYELFLLDYRARLPVWTIRTQGGVTGPGVFSPQGKML